MKEQSARSLGTGGVLAVLLLFGSCAWTQEKTSTKDWAEARPSSVGLDASKLAAFDADIASGKYGLIDSMLVIRCGQQAYARSYSHDYRKIYGDLAKKEGPLNHDVNGEFNYFSADLHPYYHYSDLHTMQSVTKSVTSVTIGIAIGRKEFPADLDTPILKYFDKSKIANVDDRKRRITLRNLLTMSAGFEWNEDLPYNDPKNSCDLMEEKNDWIQYVLNQPMAAEPGKTFVYNSGATELLAYIFKKTTGKNVDEYAAEHLFKPLAMRYYWKHTPLGLPDTEGGLYLSASDLARIGFLFLHNGNWQGRQIVLSDWVKASVTPSISAGDAPPKWKYGFQWWMRPYSDSPEQLVWAARGFGGQNLYVVPEYNLVAVFTGWSILPSTQGEKHDQLDRVLAAVDRQHHCASLQ
jgi:CubicO group peptidase (beta-lactamase class C family)